MIASRSYSFFLTFLLASFLLSKQVWAPISSGKCQEPGLQADVIFQAKALGTQRADTEMEVIRVLKGEVHSGKIVFKHALRPTGLDAGDIDLGKQYYALKKGRTYLIHAKKTSRENVFSQLYGADYCSESVSPLSKFF